MNISEARAAILELGKIDVRMKSVSGYIDSYKRELEGLQQKRSELHQELIKTIVDDFKLPLNNNYLNTQALSFLSGLITETEKVVRAEVEKVEVEKRKLSVREGITPGQKEENPPPAPMPKTSRAINLES